MSPYALGLFDLLPEEIVYKIFEEAVRCAPNTTRAAPKGQNNNLGARNVYSWAVKANLAGVCREFRRRATEGFCELDLMEQFNGIRRRCRLKKSR